MNYGFKTAAHGASLVYVHGVSEVPDDALGTQAASLEFLRIAAFTMEHLFVAHRNAAATNPVLAIARVNMIEIGQTGNLGIGYVVRISDRLPRSFELAARIGNLIDLELTPRSYDYGESM